MSAPEMTTTMVDLAESQRLLLSTLTRISACASFVCSAYLSFTILRNPYCRRRIYHRIMLGCAISTMILNINMIWGQAAVPKGTPGFPQAQGTTATCTLQGFVYTMGQVVPFYYVALSLLCYAAISNKFQVEKYRWIEPYIHVGVYSFPLVSGCYILSAQGYNPSITECWFTSYPLGCGDQSDGGAGVDCIRGPQNYVLLTKWLVCLPLAVVMLFPTVTMAILSAKVRRLKGPSGREVASSVAKQALVYLSALYWTYLFRFIFVGLGGTTSNANYIFTLHVLANIMESMQGVWISMAYYYLRSERSIDLAPHGGDRSWTRKKKQGSGKHAGGRIAIVGDTTAQDVPDESDEQKQQQHESDSKELPPEDSTVGAAEVCQQVLDVQGSTTDAAVNLSQKNQHHHHFGLSRPTFSIFDGSAKYVSESPWSQFLYDDGEDDEYKKNCGEYDDTVFDMEACLRKSNDRSCHGEDADDSSDSATIET